MKYFSLADTETGKIAPSRTDKGVQTKEIIITVPIGEDASSLTLSDGSKSYVINCDVGVNVFCIPLLFKPQTDVTLTAAGVMTVFVETFDS